MHCMWFYAALYGHPSQCLISEKTPHFHVIPKAPILFHFVLTQRSLTPVTLTPVCTACVMSNVTASPVSATPAMKEHFAKTVKLTVI